MRFVGKLLLAGVLAAAYGGIIYGAVAQQPKVPESYTITLSPQEVDLMWGIMIERPYKDVEPFLRKLRDQVSQQQMRAAAPSPPPPPPPPAPETPPADNK